VEKAAELSGAGGPVRAAALELGVDAVLHAVDLVASKDRRERLSSTRQALPRFNTSNRRMVMTWSPGMPKENAEEPL